MFDFKKFFKQENIIKCEMFHSALSINMVNNFLTKTLKLSGVERKIEIN